MGQIWIWFKRGFCSSSAQVATAIYSRGPILDLGLKYIFSKEKDDEKVIKI